MEKANRKANTPSRKERRKKRKGMLSNSPVKTVVSTEMLQKMIKAYKALNPDIPASPTMEMVGTSRRRQERDIPYGFSQFFKGTENPVFRLKLQETRVNLTQATVYSSVYNVQAQFLQNFDDLANMFDEYRFIRGEMEVIPSAVYVPPTTAPAVPTTCFLAGACIDYGVSGALGSINAGIGHDTWNWCNFVNSPGIEKLKELKHKWQVKLEKLTDETWIPTTTNNSSILFWKPYIPAADIPVSVTSAFRIQGAFDVQFRNQAG